MKDKKPGQACPGSGWGTGIRTPIDGSKVRSPAVRRSPNANLIIVNSQLSMSGITSHLQSLHNRYNTIRIMKNLYSQLFRCRDPDLNWGHQHFQCCALPTELSRPAESCPYRKFYTGLFLQKSRPESRPFRAGDEIRTHDLLLGKETFYH